MEGHYFQDKAGQTAVEAMSRREFQAEDQLGHQYPPPNTNNPIMKKLNPYASSPKLFLCIKEGVPIRARIYRNTRPLW